MGLFYGQSDSTVQDSNETRAGIPNQRIGMHCLRHGFLTTAQKLQAHLGKGLLGV